LRIALLSAALIVSAAALRTEIAVAIAIASTVTVSPIALFLIVAVARLLRRAATGDESGQAAALVLLAALVLVAALLRITLKIWLRLGLRRLRPILRLRRLPHRGTAGIGLRIGIAGRGFVASAVSILVLFAAFHVRTLIGLLRLMRVLLGELRLRRRDQAEVMFSVLQIPFGRYRIARRLGIARKLRVLFGDVVRGAAYFHIRAVRLVNAGQRIVSAVAIAAPHALLLSISHFRKSLCFAAASRLLRSRHSNDRHANPAFAGLHS